MFNIFGSFTTLFEIGLLIVGLMLVGGVLRFILRVAWRIISLVLSLVIIAGIFLIVMQFIRIH